MRSLQNLWSIKKYVSSMKNDIIEELSFFCQFLTHFTTSQTSTCSILCYATFEIPRYVQQLVQGESERHFVENPHKLIPPLLTMLLCQHTAPLVAETQSLDNLLSDRFDGLNFQETSRNMLFLQLLRWQHDNMQKKSLWSCTITTHDSFGSYCFGGGALSFYSRL